MSDKKRKGELVTQDVYNISFHPFCFVFIFPNKFDHIHFTKILQSTKKQKTSDPKEKVRWYNLRLNYVHSFPSFLCTKDSPLIISPFLPFSIQRLRVIHVHLDMIMEMK